jgi:hypothetical protein
MQPDEEQPDEEPRHSSLPVGNWTDPDADPEHGPKYVLSMIEILMRSPHTNSDEIIRLVKIYKDLTGEAPPNIGSIFSSPLPS